MSPVCGIFIIKPFNFNTWQYLNATDSALNDTEMHLSLSFNSQLRVSPVFQLPSITLSALAGQVTNLFLSKLPKYKSFDRIFSGEFYFLNTDKEGTQQTGLTGTVCGFKEAIDAEIRHRCTHTRPPHMVTLITAQTTSPT